MAIFAVIVTYYDSLWSDPDGIFLDSAFSTEEKAERRAREIKATYADDCSVSVRAISLDIENNETIQENRIRIR
jgi:hypothetical protein